ncbi:hypothetical protein DAPPUDRAFT_326548 [Daphnia pulex]|uniref:Uncharacterized protein n=1 Tax=Daphnia pulex TaxID=6669 RepID=E9H828_DAPPU|nr:hypothetical protein DAPPUDRAFT_326548 [Daphnia pulex]|eukprot:EFX72133.1 hypothetical protein DAPPUDRAFT_326548 [Daphnia pulex]
MATTAADWSDPARYAYASLFALSLNERHSHESCADPEFRQRSLRRLLEHVKLMRCEPMMQLLMLESESGHTRDPYVQMLLEEPEFHGDGTRVVYDALQWALVLGHYDARIRVILHEWATQLFGLSVEHFEMLEDAIVHRVERGLATKTLQEEEREKKEMKMKKVKKFAWIGAASVGGGVLVGLTGGLVAPLVGASLAALLGVGGGAAAAGSVTGAAVIGSLFGAAGAGVSGYKMNKRVGDVEEFFFVRLSPGQGSRLHVTICCPGWLPPPDRNQLAEESEDDENGDDDEIGESIERRLMQSFDGLIHSREQYGLQYETKYLAEMGRAIDAVCRLAISMAATQVLKMTIFHGLVTAVALPRTILSLTSVIDNPWNVCCNRSAQVGQMLAETLMGGTFGRRPVTLLGFSLGARVVYFCLKELHRRGGRGIVQDAVLIGTPVTGNASEWRPLLDVVAGRLVNAFSRNDWVLKIVYRTASAAYDVAGLEGVDIQHDQLVNVDLSHLISGHGDYRTKADQCLKAIALLRVIPITTTTTTTSQQQQQQQSQV